MSAGAGATAAAAAAAAAQDARMQEEEEKLTTYNPDDLNGWEFKIVRSSTSISGDKFLRLCEEEAQNGWELVEKFDDYRVRFKRPVARRAYDSQAVIDPYRTKFGISDAKIILLVVLGSFGLFLALTLGIMMLR